MRFAFALLSVVLAASPALARDVDRPPVGNPGKARVEPLKENSSRVVRLKELAKTIQYRNAREVTDPEKPHDFVWKGKRFTFGRTFHHGQIFAARGWQSLHYGGLSREVQAYLKGGIFDPASYGNRSQLKTIFRASHGRPDPSDDWDLSRDERGNDVRGGAWLWPVGPNDEEWQALTVTGPARAQFVPNGLHFLELFDEVSRGKEPGVKRSIGGLIAHGLGLPGALRERLGGAVAAGAAARLVGGTMPAGALLRNIMESSAAIQVGRWGNVPRHLWPANTSENDPIVARFALVPRERPYSQSLASRLARGVRYGKLVNRDPKYQRRGAAATLAKGPVTYDLQLQFYIDDELTPIDDSSKPWDREVAPPITVGSVKLNRQAIDVANPSAFERAVDKHAAFGPQVRARRIQVPANPAGQMGQDRDAPYDESSAVRAAGNQKLIPFFKSED